MAGMRMDGRRLPGRGCWMAVLAGVGACFFVVMALQVLRLPSAYPVGDFFAIWSSARVLASATPLVAYDPAALHALQQGMGLDTPEMNPYPYPPQAALLFVGLAGLGYWAAALVWLGVGLGIFLLALGVGSGARGRGVVLAGLLAPGTAVTLAFGQGGLLVAGLLVGGLRLMERRPLLAGVLFGVLTFKPQFGLMVPMALLALRGWRCMAAAAVTTGVLAGVATAWMGGGVWAAWLASLPGYQAWFAGRAMGIMPTMEAALLQGGVPRAGAEAGQLLALVAAAWCVWRAWRDGHAARVPITLAATALGTPHGFVYDLPVLTAGVVLFVGQMWHERGLGTAAMAVLAGALALPAVMVTLEPAWPLAPPLMMAVLAVFIFGGAAPLRLARTGTALAIAGRRPA